MKRSSSKKPSFILFGKRPQSKFVDQMPRLIASDRSLGEAVEKFKEAASKDLKTMVERNGSAEESLKKLTGKLKQPNARSAGPSSSDIKFIRQASGCSKRVAERSLIIHNELQKLKSKGHSLSSALSELTKRISTQLTLRKRARSFSPESNKAALRRTRKKRRIEKKREKKPRKALKKRRRQHTTTFDDSMDAFGTVPPAPKKMKKEKKSVTTTTSNAPTFEIPEGNPFLKTSVQNSSFTGFTFTSPLASAAQIPVVSDPNPMPLNSPPPANTIFSGDSDSSLSEDSNTTPGRKRATGTDWEDSERQKKQKLLHPSKTASL